MGSRRCVSCGKRKSRWAFYDRRYKTCRLCCGEEQEEPEPRPLRTKKSPFESHESMLNAAVDAWGTPGAYDPELGYAPGTPDAILTQWWNRYQVQGTKKVEGRPEQCWYASVNRAAIDGYHRDMAEIVRRVYNELGLICATCGGPLPTPHAGRLFCNEECRPKKSDVGYCTNVPTRRCEFCDGDYARKAYESDKVWGNRQFCSASCAAKALNAKRKAEGRHV